MSYTQTLTVIWYCGYPNTVTDLALPRYVRMLNYIRKNPDCTKTKAINHISTSSPGPATETLKWLIKEKRVFWFEDKNNSSIHHLRINDQDTFNLIYGKLDLIEIVVTGMDETVKEIMDMGERLWQHSDKHDVFSRDDNLRNLVTRFLQPYRHAVNLMLQRLLMKIAKNPNLSEDDSQVLHSKIIELMLKVIKQSYDIDYRLAVDIMNLEGFAEELQFTSFGMKSINPQAVACLPNLLRDFEKDIPL